MAINFSKDLGASLTTEDVALELAWGDYEGGSASDLDLDLILLLMNANERMPDENCVYYHHKSSKCGSVKVGDDSRTPSDENDVNENACLKLNNLPKDIMMVKVIVAIYRGRERRQKFSNVNGFLRVKINDGKELGCLKLKERFARHDFVDKHSGAILDDDNCNAMVVCEFERVNGKWNFKIPVPPEIGGLHDVVRGCGFDVLDNY